MNNLCFNRFTLRTDDAKTRRKILRWLALNYRLYECLPSEAEIRGRFISRKPFPAEAFRRQIGKLHGDRTLLLRIVSTDLYTLYVEGNVYLLGAWYRNLSLACSATSGRRHFHIMAYESSIPFADIRDFREAGINGIPALFHHVSPRFRKPSRRFIRAR